MGDKEHHVHFSGGIGLGKDNNIMIQPQRHGHIDAYLGFLQLHHRYHVEFSVPWNTCVHPEGADGGFIPAIAGNHSANCHIIEFLQEKDDLRLKVEIFAYKEKIIKEEVEVMCCSLGMPLKIVLNARVLSKDMGRPLLRNGIYRISIEEDKNDISEFSDSIILPLSLNKQQRLRQQI